MLVAAGFKPINLLRYNRRYKLHFQRARKQGKTQEEAAKIVGVTQQAVDKWESENVTNTTGCNAHNVNKRNIISNVTNHNANNVTNATGCNGHNVGCSRL